MCLNINTNLRGRSANELWIVGVQREVLRVEESRETRVVDVQRETLGGNLRQKRTSSG